jgi:hypothetical protein
MRRHRYKRPRNQHCHNEDSSVANKNIQHGNPTFAQALLMKAAASAR